jgi:thiamine transport system substrate-binding protein
MSEDIIKKKTNYVVYVVIGLVVLAGTLVYFTYPDIVTSQEPTINILTYGSFFDSGANPNQTLKYLIDNFENWHHVKIKISYASTDLFGQIVETKGTGYDIVIGLNNLDSYLAAKSGYFYHFNVSNASYVNKTLYSFIQSSGYVIPYEYSPLTTDYNLSGPINTSIIQNLSFSDFYNSTIANQYILENPGTLNINGEDFLLGQIAFYTGILHENWTTFWESSKGIQITSDWSSGFTLFENGQRQMFFSYATDPAYNAYFNESPIGTTPFHYGGKSYAWMQVLGVGILNSSKYHNIDEEFVNWLLGNKVQNLIPLNEWMYPANENIILPHVYSVNPPVSSIIPLNFYLNMSVAANNISTWSLEWSSIEG